MVTVKTTSVQSEVHIDPLERTISLFTGVGSTYNPNDISVRTFLERIKTGFYKEAVCKIRALKYPEDKTEYNRIKDNNPAVIVSIHCKNRDSFCTIEKKAIAYNNIVCLDLDLKGDKEITDEILENIRNIIISDPFTLACFKSVGGKGFKIFVQIDIDGTIDNELENRHKVAYFALIEYYNNQYDINMDPACKNLFRLCSFSWDENLFINEKPEVFNSAKIDIFNPEKLGPNQPNNDYLIDPNAPPADSALVEKIAELGCNLLSKNGYKNQRHIARLHVGTLVGGYEAYHNVSAEDCKLIRSKLLEASDQIADGGRTAPGEVKTLDDAINYGKTQPIPLIGTRVSNNGSKKANNNSKPAKSNSKSKSTIKGIDSNGIIRDWKIPAEMDSLTEVGNAARFAADYIDMARFNHTTGQWCLWNGHKWETDLTRKIITLAKHSIRKLFLKAMEMEHGEERKKLTNFVNTSETRSKIDSMLYLASNELGVTFSDFDKNLHLINTLNGVYDLKNNVFTPGNKPSDLMSKVCNVTYDPNATCPQWFSFLAVTFNDATKNEPDYALINFVKRAVGFSLCGEQLDEVLFFCYGNGKNGKSVFFNVYQMILNDYFQKAPIQMILLKYNDSVPNDIAMLPGARVVVTEEMPENRTLDEQKIKDLTGGELITARFLRKEFFTFKPSHTQWMYGNHKPNIKGTDEGIWRRIILIPFLNKVDEKDRKPQHVLMAQFEKEKAGIFNWMIQGWLEYTQDGLKKPPIIDSSTLEYRSEQDQVKAFVDECCTLSPVENVLKADLMATYKEWCRKLNENPVPRTTFYKRIESMQGISSTIGHGNQKRFQGIKSNIEMDSQSKISFKT